MNGFEVFEWTVRFLHARNSFARTERVEAINHREAVSKAEAELEAKGYESGDFVVTALERGRWTGVRRS